MRNNEHPLDYYAARRERREARWNRPILSPRERLRAWADLLFADHGVLRLAYLNLHRVSAQVWRSAQPSPRDIAKLRAMGLATIVNLRGGRSHGAWQLEKDAAERHGITIVDLVLRSREPPDRETLLALPAFFSSLSYPVLAHCKSGADRAGLFAALYLLVVEHADVQRAQRELSLRSGHFRYAQTGILDAFLESYRDEGEAKGKPFLDWVRDDYRPDDLKLRFKPRPLSSLFADVLLRRE
ncbi:COG2365 Protein tyrosine/serine phosphatase [Rhabdaerophilaceae bacterium]